MSIANPTPAPGEAFGAAISIWDSRLVIGDPGEDVGTTNAGAAYVYDLDSGTPTVPVLRISNPLGAGDFGLQVALVGNTLAVGLTGINGRIWLYDLDSSEAIYPTAVAHNPDPSIASIFGEVLALSETHIALGIHRFGAGSAYIFPLGDLTPPASIRVLRSAGPSAQDKFGSAVAVSGRLLVAGSPFDDTGAADAGVACVYDLLSESATVPMLTLRNPTPAAAEQFGSAVAVSGDYVLVAARNDGTGKVYAYDLSRESPEIPIITLAVAGGFDAGLGFGFAVAISGSLVVVGYPDENTGANSAGSVFVYDLNSTTPAVPIKTLRNPAPAGEDKFGYAVSISGTRVVIGALGVDAGASDAGTAYVYDLNGPAPTSPIYTLNNPSPGLADRFGHSVGIAGNRIIVGAPYDDTAAFNSGTAYVYDINSANPVIPTLVLNNPEPAEGDVFGFTVAISGSQVVVASPGDDAEGTNAGRAYVYDLRITNSALPIATLNKSRPVIGDAFGNAVSIDGATVAVGTALDDSLMADKGYVYVFGPPQRFELTLSGNGLPIVSGDTTPALMDHTDFGPTTAPGGVSLRTFTITNTGTVPLQLTGNPAVQISGSHTERFTLTVPPAAIVPAGGSTTFTVAFTPAAQGLYQATLSIPHNGATGSPFSFLVQGTGATPLQSFNAAMAAAGLTGSNAEPLAAPRGDGVANLLKYAFNMNAAAADRRILTPGTGTAGLPVISLTGTTAAKVLRVEFLRRKGSGLTYTPRKTASVTAGPWQTLTDMPTVTNIDATWERVVYEEPVTGARWFARVEVALP